MAQNDTRETATATIAAAGSLSGAVALGGQTLVGITAIPATFDATTTNLQFQVSIDGTNYYLLNDMDGDPVAVIVAATNTNKCAWFGDQFKGFNSVKVGTYKTDGATAQTQTAEKTFTLITK